MLLGLSSCLSILEAVSGDEIIHHVSCRFPTMSLELTNATALHWPGKGLESSHATVHERQQAEHYIVHGTSSVILTLLNSANHLTTDPGSW